MWPSLCCVSLLVACAAWSIIMTDARPWHEPTEHWLLVLVFLACVLRFAWRRLSPWEAEVANQAGAILANNPLTQRLVEKVLLSSDLAPLFLANTGSADVQISGSQVRKVVGHSRCHRRRS